MGQTPIEWTDYTFNPVWGCEKISPGCKNCYAMTWDKRLGGKHWGPGSARRQFGEKHWAQPLAWNAKAKRDGRIYRVFCASMADWLEDHLDWIEPRARLEALVAATPNLIWLFLTKRPENWRLMPKAWLERWPSNAMFGMTGENDQWFHKRAGELVADLPAKIPLFLSAEPLLGAINDERLLPMFSWCIVGGESGHGARPMHPDWARSLRDQCNAAGVPFLFKQWGEWLPISTPRLKATVEGAKRTVIMPTYHPLWPFEPVGKKAAGRLLDGREWNELPKYWPANVGLLEPELDPLKVIA